MMLIPLERYDTHTLLGVRFWDRLTQRCITDGLIVTAQRLSQNRSQRLGKPVRGILTPSGAIAFLGLTAAERPLHADSDLWGNPPDEQFVRVDLVDRRSQFLPMSFIARLPFRGVFCGQGDWLRTSLLRPEPPPGEALGIQLWSAPTRSLPPGRALIRGQMVVGTSDRPAAYALVRVRLPASEPESEFDYFAMADHQGKVAIPMPYPRVPEPESASTPYSSLDQQRFALRVTVQYQDIPILPGYNVPDLETLLTQSPSPIGDRWTTGATPRLRSRDSLSVTLQFGQPLTLRTARGPGGNAPQESVLRLLPT
ncbi:MAG TPA: hypothetical protein V6D20_22870 [Candidatus Obscuribacterales bacterium]